MQTGNVSELTPLATRTQRHDVTSRWISEKVRFCNAVMLANMGAVTNQIP